MQFPLEVTCGPLASLRAKNSGRPGRPVWGWGDLQSGRRSTACCGRQAAATRYGTSSLSESPSGRDGTLAHPEQLARCCQGSPELCSYGSQRGASFVLRLRAGSSGEEGGERMSPPRPAVRGHSKDNAVGDRLVPLSATLGASRVCLCSPFVPCPKPL